MLLIKGYLCCFSPLPRLRARSRSSSSRKTDVKRTRKSRKRRRRRSYSPLKKRRRDSPSHLEARRITRLTPPHWIYILFFLLLNRAAVNQRMNVALELADEYFLTCQINKLWNQATEQTITTCGVPTKAGANPSERALLMICFATLTLACLSEHLRPFPHHRRPNSWADFNPTAPATYQIDKCLFFLPPPPVPESVPSLTSAPVPPLSAAQLASPPGAASSPAAAAGAGAKATPPTGATAAAHPGTPSLVHAAAVGVGARWANATGPGTSLLSQYHQPEPPLLFPAERGDGVGAVVRAPLCAPQISQRGFWFPVVSTVTTADWMYFVLFYHWSKRTSLIITKKTPEMQLASLLTKSFPVTLGRFVTSIPGHKPLVFKTLLVRTPWSLRRLIFIVFPPQRRMSRLLPVKHEAAEVSWQRERTACRLKCQIIYPDQVGKCQRL